MTDPVFKLRAGQSGPVVTGTPGHVLTFDASGDLVSGQPGGGGPSPPFPVADIDASGVPDGELVTAAGGLATWAAPAAPEPAQPFRAEYYINPAFVGVQTGSSENPYTTVAAAFAAALALGITSGILFVPVNATITENIVFPAAGGNWEIACKATWGYFSALINGTIDLSGAATCRRALTNMQVTGAVTGNSPAGTFSRARFYGCAFDSTLTLTSAAGGGWRGSFVGSMPQGGFGLGGFSTGAVSIAGQLEASNWRFNTAPAFRDVAEFWSVGLDVGFSSFNAAQAVAFLHDCTAQFNPQVLTASTGSLRVQFDANSANSFAQAGTTIVGAVTQVVDGSSRLTLAGNSGVITVNNVYPESQQTVTVTTTLLVAGTLGAIQPLVTYTDLLGNLKHVNCGPPLDITSAAGTEVTGTITFNQNGATNVQLQMQGVVTPGALSYTFSYGSKIAA